MNKFRTENKISWSIRLSVWLYFFLSMALLILIPVKANANAFCDLKPGNQALVDRVGRIVGSINGPQHVSVWKVDFEEFTIPVQGGHITVYRLNGSDKFIDINSCASLSTTGAALSYDPRTGMSQ